MNKKFKILTIFLGIIMGITINSNLVLGEKNNNKNIDEIIKVLKDKKKPEKERCEAIKSLAKIGTKKAINSLISALNDKNWKIRKEIVIALGDIGDKEAVDALIICLNDKNWVVRSNSAISLGKIGDKKAIKPLILALKDEQPAVREKSVRALGMFKEDEVIKPLITVLGDKDEKIQEVACEGLVNVGKKAIKPLITALESPNPDIRKNAAYCLGMLQSEDSIPLLLNLLANDKNAKVREYAAFGLGKIGSPKTVEPLIIALKDEDKEVRGGVSYALGSIGDKKAIKPLVEIAKQDEDVEVRINAIHSLIKLGENVTELLAQLLQNKDDKVRMYAVTKLGEIKDEKAINLLIDTLQNDSNHDVRRLAGASLEKIGKPAINPLIGLLKSEDKNTREISALSLGQIGGKEVVTPLLNALRNEENSRTRKFITTALGKVGEEAIKELIEALNDKAEFVRWYAGVALGKIGKPGQNYIIQPLIEALKSESWYARGGAAIGLGKIGDKSAVVPLMNTLKNEKIDNVKLAVIEALGMIGDSRAIEELTAIAQKDLDPLMRKKAWEAINKIIGEDIVEPSKKESQCEEGGKKGGTCNLNY